MSKQTIPTPSKPTKETPAGKTPTGRSTRGRLYRRQTARVEERRDGKPLIFGWGKHLSRRQKDKIQKRAFWTFAIVVPLIVIGVLGYAYYDLNYAIPGEPIVTVNGHNIPQSLFRKLNFYLSQDLANQLAAVQQKMNAAQVLANSSDQATQIEGEKELNDLNSQQQVLNEQYSIPTVGSESAQDLIDDELIQEQIPQLEAQGVPASKLEATDQDINAKLQAFKKAIPSSTTYQTFLSQGKMSEDDLRQILAIVIRHDKMDAYQQSLFGPIGPQVHASLIQVATQQSAQAILAQLQREPASDLAAAFAKLAKQKSTDSNTKTKGGDMGWIVYGQLSTGAAPERWLFDPTRKAGDLSPVIEVVSDEYNIYYISAIDPHRPISDTILQQLKTNALDHWIGQLKALPQTKISDIDTSKQLDPNNFPSGLPSGAATSTGG
jgi:parvulin-like peptidyl-prolyl isomerase